MIIDSLDPHEETQFSRVQFNYIGGQAKRSELACLRAIFVYVLL